MEFKQTLPMHHGSNKIKWIPEETYHIIKHYIPIPCIDVFIEKQKKGFLWIKRNIPPQYNQWAPVGGRILKFETPQKACKRIARKEVGLDIVVKEFIGFSEFQEENHFISLNFIATLKKHQKIHLNKNEVSQYMYSYELPSGAADQYKEIFTIARSKIYEKEPGRQT
ncbi:MAG: NUDIX hydrolase [Candidatus Thermoplasmatota archaeon]|nr:NUDIX hydrolase [Candidatus Thermoplasmatota archaeon]